MFVEIVNTLVFIRIMGCFIINYVYFWVDIVFLGNVLCIFRGGMCFFYFY